MKKETKKVSCKHLCIDCQHHNSKYVTWDNTEDLCSAHKARKSTSCINGETHTSTVRCIEHNDKGQCKLFDPKEELQLIKALQKYSDSHPLDIFCRRTVDQVLVDDLLRVVEGEESNYLEMVYDFEDPYSGGVVATVAAINKSINRRGYNISEVERGHCGSYVECRTADEIRKERSWLGRVKYWLACLE